MTFFSLFIAAAPFVARSQEDPALLALPTLLVTGVSANHSSARVFFEPVPGARDYRIFDVSNPNDVKYAGQARYTPGSDCPGDYCVHHFAPDSSGNPVYPYQVVSDNSIQPTGPLTVQDVAATDVEWNGLGDTAQHTLIVQALDALGPVPPANLYSGPATGAKVPLAPGGMLGSNKGPTSDGKISTNGQGPFTNKPNVIAQSQPFLVQANRTRSPVSTGQQQFLDTFDNSEAPSLTRVAHSDCGNDKYGGLGGNATFSLNGGTAKEWTLEYRQANMIDSMPFIASNHFMDMLFAGMSPGCSGPADTIYGSMAMTPTQTANVDGGALHMTLEVDMHSSFRRWMGLEIGPASDPLQTWSGSQQINNANQSFNLDMNHIDGKLHVYNGGTGAPTAVFTQDFGFGSFWIADDLQMEGRGIDDRSKVDMFVSQTHVDLYIDGQLVFAQDIPATAMPWFSQGPVKAYFTHYLYHSTADVQDLKTWNNANTALCYPLNSYWFNDPISGTPANATPCNVAYPMGYGFPYSDERHWDNMGFEVLPSGSVPGNNFAPLVQPPPVSAPEFTNGGSPVPTSTAVPASPTSTVSAVPSSTSAATMTPAPIVQCRVSIEINGTPGPYRDC